MRRAENSGWNMPSIAPSGRGSSNIIDGYEKWECRSRTEKAPEAFLCLSIVPTFLEMISDYGTAPDHQWRIDVYD
jgi:hypothetical protein